MILSLVIKIYIISKKSKWNIANYQGLLFINKKHYKTKDRIDHKDNLLNKRHFCIYIVPTNLKNRSYNYFHISIQANLHLNSTFLYYKMYIINCTNLYNTDLNIHLRTNIDQVTITQLFQFLPFDNIQKNSYDLTRYTKP